MARLRALLCGVDDLRCFEDLWAAGYSVDRCDNEFELVRWLVRGRDTDLICVLESPDRPLDLTSISLLKGSTDAPLVLFRAGAGAHGKDLWSLEVAPRTPSRDWLQSIELLMAGRQAPEAEA